MASTDTQYKTTAPISQASCTATCAAQWFLEKPEDHAAPVFHANNLDLFICGEDAFKQIAADLKNAKGSVEIICWGFDPAMELIRTGTTWPRGDTWGGLLRDVAVGKYNGGKPVQVRILSWYGFIGSSSPGLGTNNMPGYSKERSTYDFQMAMAEGAAGGYYLQSSTPPRPQTPQEKRKDFNARWYDDAFHGRLANVSIRTRDGNSEAVSESLKAELGNHDRSETLSLEDVATDHQKTILIDYDHQGGVDAVGYVMGLNSVTDYWDTQQHLFHDPRRGETWEGASQPGPGLKPYQDYASRIRGDALVAVSKNFTDAWKRAKGKGGDLARNHDLKSPPRGLASKLAGATQRVQVVRTQPEEHEKTIKRLYTQATSFARNYIYVENQYFQYADWALELRKERARYAQGWQAAGKSPGDLPNLHVMIVIPIPEHGFMVPRTYDTVKTLGQGTSMPNQDKSIEDELKRNAEATARWNEYCKKQAAIGELPDPDYAPAPLSAAAESAKAVGRKDDIARSMESMGLRSLVGSLWSFNSSMTSDLFEHAPFSVPGVKAQRSAQDLYREIYIHSKLMVIDDSFLTVGSANLNLRSMVVDAEINIGTDDAGKSKELRQRAWKLHSGNAADCDGGDGSPHSILVTFTNWKKLMQKNALAKAAGEAIGGFLVPFEDFRTAHIRLA